MQKTISKKNVTDVVYKYFSMNNKMILLNSDDGFFVLDKFYLHKNRAYNVGIAEQATMSVAAGMAMSGLEPIVYGKIPFLVMRAYEQIRYDINEHNLKVKIIGVGANNSLSILGRSHCMDDDDIKMMELLKNFLILTPTENNVDECVRKFIEYDGPAYIRCD